MRTGSYFRRRFVRLFSILAILAFVHLSLAAQTQKDAQLAAHMRHVAQFYHDRDGFSGVIAVERNHRLVFQASYGYANYEKQTPFKRNTRFAVASLSKQFTAAAILLLQQDGKLKTSDLLKQHYTQTPAAWGAVTLRHLLTHSSGIPDVYFGDLRKQHEGEIPQTLRALADKPLSFEPGAKYDYSNANYLLLARVVEEASGESYCQFLSERIFRPLRMRQTSCIWKTQTIRNRANGYMQSAKGPAPDEDEDLGGLTGAGSLASTAGDLIRWTEALQGGKVLSQSSLNEMQTPYKEEYAEGLVIQGKGKELDIGHVGKADGFYSQLDYVPAIKTTLVVLSNLVTAGFNEGPGALEMDDELTRLMENADSILPSDGKEAKVPEEVLRGYAGHYLQDGVSNPAGATVSFQDGRLFLHVDGKAPVALYAESSDRFYIEGEPEEVFFAPADNGGSSTLIVVKFFPPFQGDSYKKATQEMAGGAAK
jgi:CubicO group peptidase (beta-lactamase class C family)